MIIKRNGGELLGSGSYGCAFANPRILCHNDKFPRDKTVSKVMLAKSATSEIKSNMIIDKLDKNYVYHVKTFGVCNKFDKTDKQITSGCSKFITKDSSLLISEYGGKDLSNPFPIEYAHNFWFNATRLFIGLNDFITNGYAHLDIRPQNILYVPPTENEIGKLSYIDFGTFRKKDAFQHADAFFAFYGYLSPICAFLSSSRLEHYMLSAKNQPLHQQLKNDLVATLTATADTQTIQRAKKWYRNDFPEHYNYLSKLMNLKPYHAQGLTSLFDIWKNALHLFFNSIDEYVKNKNKKTLYDDFIRRADIFGVGLTLYFALMNFKKNGFGSTPQSAAFIDELEGLFTTMTNLQLEKQETNTHLLSLQYIAILQKHCHFPEKIPRWYIDRFGVPVKNNIAPPKKENVLNKQSNVFLHAKTIFNFPTPMIATNNTLSKSKTKTLKNTLLTTLLDNNSSTILSVKPKQNNSLPKSHTKSTSKDSNSLTKMLTKSKKNKGSQNQLSLMLPSHIRHYLYYFYLLLRYPSVCVNKIIEITNNTTNMLQQAATFFVNCILQTDVPVSFFPVYIMNNDLISFHVLLFKKQFRMLEHYQPFAQTDHNNEDIMNELLQYINLSVTNITVFTMFHVHKQQHCPLHLRNPSVSQKQKLSKSVSLQSPLLQANERQSCNEYLFFLLEFSIVNPEISISELLQVTLSPNTPISQKAVDMLIESYLMFANDRMSRYLKVYDFFKISTIHGNVLLKTILMIELLTFNHEQIKQTKINEKIISILYV